MTYIASPRVVIIWLVLVLSPLAASAQPLTESWPGLKPNGLDTVYVLDEAGVETTGKLLAWTPDALILWRGGAEQRLDRRDVVRVQKRDSLRNGVIAGAVVGGVMGLLTAAISDCPSSSESGCVGSRSALWLVSTVTYTGMGVGLDALVRGRTTVYSREAPARHTSITARVTRSQASLGVGVRW